MSLGTASIWRVRPSGNNTNGGGFDPSVGSPGTDYSQQNAAQVTFNGTTVTATTAGISAVITISGYTVGATDPGNILHILGGANFVAGWYEIISRSGSTWTLDRNCTTGAGSGMTGSMGGAWADFWTNTSSGAGILTPGNIVYILGSGTPNPASYSVDYTFPNSTVTPAAGDNTNGLIRFIVDPATPGYIAPPDTTGGMPVVQLQASSKFTMNTTSVEGLWFVWVASPNVNFFDDAGSVFVKIYACVVDAFGCATGHRFMQIGSPAMIMGNEFFSSVAVGSYVGSQFLNNNAYTELHGNNLHDLPFDGLYWQQGGSISNNIFSNLLGDAIQIRGNNGPFGIKNNTVDNCGGNGLYLDTGGAGRLSVVVVFSNIFSNGTAASTAAVKVSTGTVVQNNAIIPFFDFNSFYNNTANYSGLSAGPHDTALGASPYVASATEDYTLA